MNFHSHADRQELGETVRQQKCKWELEQIREEWKTRERIGDEVLKKLSVLEDRWA